MNIFILDPDPKLCAQYHCDKHLVKMITEHNQILGSIAHIFNGAKKRSDITPQYVKENFRGFPRTNEKQEPFPYGIGYRTHPCTQWAMECLENYLWLCQLTLEMCVEFTSRFNKKHAGETVCLWYWINKPSLERKGTKTPFAQAMPDYLRSSDAVSSYRRYYAEKKAYFAKWKNGEPSWWKEQLELASKVA